VANERNDMPMPATLGGGKTNTPVSGERAVDIARRTGTDAEEIAIGIRHRDIKRRDQAGRGRLLSMLDEVVSLSSLLKCLRMPQPLRRMSSTANAAANARSQPGFVS
jgi:hypothetical protein